MITVTGLELRAGARALLTDVTFRVQPGDRIGLVGRNGAGKTTLTKTLAGETLPAAGTITRSGEIGYLPQDPRTGDLDVLARDRVLSARGLDDLVRKMEKTQVEMAERLDAVVNKVFHLDANRAELDQYNVGWKPYLQQRETDEKRRKRERANAEKQAGALLAQADKMRAKATKAKAAQSMAKRAERMLASTEGVRAQDRVAKLRFPEPA